MKVDKALKAVDALDVWHDVHQIKCPECLSDIYWLMRSLQQLIIVAVFM